MPHVVVLYTGNLEQRSDMAALCRSLADTMLTVRAEDGSQVFPTGGTRVYAYPAPHFAVADGGAAGKAAGGILLMLEPPPWMGKAAASGLSCDS